MAREQIVEYGRFLETEGLFTCLVCSQPVDPRHPRSGTFGLAQELAPQLPVHLDCLNTLEVANVTAMYHRKLMDGGGLAEQPLPARTVPVH